MNRVARDPIYDFLKGVMMLLIIGGHLVGLKVIAPTVKEGVSYFSNFCIAVEMPVFFIISGYFARKTLDDRNIWKILSNLANFIWPMISFGWLFGLILWLVGSIDFMAMVKYPIVMARGLWFLRVLFWVYLLSAVICYFARQTWMRNILFLLAYVALLFNPIVSHHWIMHEEPHMLPFFVFGLLCLRRYELHKLWRVAMPCGVVFLTIVFLEGNVHTNGMRFYAVDPTWTGCFGTLRVTICTFGRFVVGITGTVFLLWLTARLLDLLPRLSILAVFGTTTLGVYVIHQWVLARLSCLSFFPLSGAYCWTVAVVAFGACHMCISSICRMEILNNVFFSPWKLVRIGLEKRSDCDCAVEGVWNSKADCKSGCDDRNICFMNVGLKGGKT